MKVLGLFAVAVVVQLVVGSVFFAALFGVGDLMDRLAIPGAAVTVVALVVTVVAVWRLGRT